MQSHTKSVPLFVSSVKAHLTASDRNMKRGFSFSCQTSERQNEIWMRRLKAAGWRTHLTIAARMIEHEEIALFTINCLVPIDINVSIWRRRNC